MTVCQAADWNGKEWQPCKDKANVKASKKQRGKPLPDAEFCDRHLAMAAGKTLEEAK